MCISELASKQHTIFSLHASKAQMEMAAYPIVKVDPYPARYQRSPRSANRVTFNPGILGSKQLLCLDCFPRVVPPGPIKQLVFTI